MLFLPSENTFCWLCCYTPVCEEGIRWTDPLPGKPVLEVRTECWDRRVKMGHQLWLSSLAILTVRPTQGPGPSVFSHINCPLERFFSGPGLCLHTMVY
ncbi:unnamed protein product, partial [Gulo gulo]